MPGTVAKKSKLVQSLGDVKQASSAPAWAGPCGAGPQGGVTQSLIGRYLSCKERFRILVVEGLKPAEKFEPTLDFGNMWHVCEEALAGGTNWEEALTKCVQGYYQRFPFDREKILHWHSMTAELFPCYVEHWRNHPDVRDRTPLLAEQEFDVPYHLPSGRTVRLRGKWDSADLVGKGSKAGVWLQENKTKGTIDGEKIRRQLRFDLQTMLYLIALGADKKLWVDDMWVHGEARILGVRYNVVRRSAHKSTDSMLKKLEEDRKAGRIEEWFARWQVTVTPDDVTRFERECLIPVLENLCDDWQWWAHCKEFNTDVFDLRAASAVHSVRHFRMPYMGYNPLAEGGFGDVDNYLETSSAAGLVRAKDLFPELAKKSE